VDDQDFDRKLSHLVGALNVDQDPTAASAPSPMLDQARARYETLRRTAQALQESIDSLRVSVKYLVFDLEATRRENADLRTQLAKLRGDKDGGATNE
jgi:predicted  nucleic acid-binding Zn-ribbon protein